MDDYLGPEYPQATDDQWFENGDIVTIAGDPVTYRCVECQNHDGIRMMRIVPIPEPSSVN